MHEQTEEVVQDLCGYLIEAEQPAQAVAVLKQFLTDPPNPPWANVMLGKCLMDLGHAEEALEAFWQALDENPALIDARFHAGLTARDMGDYQQAINHFKEVILLNTKDARVYNLMGECCVAMEMTREAALFFAQARRLAPDFAAPIENLRKLWAAEEAEGPAAVAAGQSDDDNWWDDGASVW